MPPPLARWRGYRQCPQCGALDATHRDPVWAVQVPTLRPPGLYASSLFHGRQCTNSDREFRIPNCRLSSDYWRAPQFALPFPLADHGENLAEPVWLSTSLSGPASKRTEGGLDKTCAAVCLLKSSPSKTIV